VFRFSRNFWFLDPITREGKGPFCPPADAYVCLVLFLVEQRIVSQDYNMRDDLAIDSSLSIVITKMKII